MKKLSNDHYMQAVAAVKTLSMDAVQKANSGHPGTPMGLAHLAVELFAHHLKYDPKDPSWPGRDRFVLSCGHASMLQYSLLHLFGEDLTLEDLKQFRQWGSKTPGHPEVFHTKGVEITTGPLGSGVSSAVGMALAEKVKHARFAAPVSDVRVVVIASDGDIQEGISHEACSLAGHWGLGNLIVFWDDNRITIDGTTDLSASEDVAMRYRAYGWHVLSIDGHDQEAIRNAMVEASAVHDKPSLIVTRTHIAHGAPKAQDTSEAHGAPLGKDEIAATKKALNQDGDATFFVPDGLYKALAELKEDKTAQRKTTDSLWNAFEETKSQPSSTSLFQQLLAAIPEKSDATRAISHTMLKVVAEHLPLLTGGSADLGKSTKVFIKDAAYIDKSNYNARNIHFGIREHGMGAIANGLTLSGLRAFASTFFVFADYMRPSIRLSALMGLPCLWVFTHDSFFVGEDGPTHQPIEQLWAMRLIPNTWVLRPADAMETAAAWAMAASRLTGPSVFALTRQKVPHLDRKEGFDPEVVLKGAYELYAPKSKSVATLLATGSEVSLALDLAKEFEKEGTPLRVVSAPCLEAFDEQEKAYKEQVFPATEKVIALEAGRGLGFVKYTKHPDRVLGIEHFGASAPDTKLAEEFGFSHAAMKKRIAAALQIA